MKAIIVYRHGSPDALQLRDIPMPEPLPNEVLIHNHFVGVNFVDTQHRAGSYYPVALPLIPGTEACGVVAAVGSDVTDFCLSGITGTKNRGSLSVTWASVNDYIATAEHLRACADAVFGAVLHGHLRLHIAGVFPLEQAGQTHLLLESRATSGKLLLKVS